MHEITATTKEQVATDESKQGGLIIMYQDVVGPALPGKVQRRLLQLHHVLISAVGPVLGTQLPCIGPETETTHTTYTQDIHYVQICKRKYVLLRTKSFK